jgi:hypothetical protein
VASFSDPLRSQLVDIVRDTQAQLFRDYRQGMQSQSSTVNETDSSPAQSDVPGESPDVLFDFSTFLAPPPVSESYIAPLP